MHKNSHGEVTRLLALWSDGDQDALERLMPLVVTELRRQAKGHFRNESNGHTLQPTALVNEVYMKLVGQRQVQWDNRRQFFAFASELMRRILVDHAKGRRAQKRGGDVVKVPLDEARNAAFDGPVDLVDLDRALTELEKLSPRQVKIVESHYFGGLTYADIARNLDVSVTTVKREWGAARLWLYNRLRSPTTD
jgi:RNA polymerase sigma-70 factor, ECF subfamily